MSPKRTWFKLPAAIILLMVSGWLLSACQFNAVRGSGNLKTETRDVSGFQRVSLAGAGDLAITQGDQESLQVEAEDNLLTYIETRVDGDTLIIGFKNVGPRNTIIPTRSIRYLLTVKDLSGITLSGAGNIHADSLKSDRLELISSGAGTLSIDQLDSSSVQATLSGLGGLTLAGQAASQQVTISGAGSYTGAKLKSENASITITGAGNATLSASSSLNIQISGAGNVNYYGEPQVSQQITGLGRVNHVAGNP